MHRLNAVMRSRHHIERPDCARRAARTRWHNLPWERCAISECQLLELGVALEVLLEFRDELLAGFGEFGALLHDIAEMQLDVGVERDSRQALAVGDAHENAARQQVSVATAI